MSRRWWVWALWGLAACGGPSEIDADDTDARETDAEETDVSASSQVTVRVVALPTYEPLVGAQILVHDAEGTTTATAATGDGGQVDVDLPPGGAVSFVERALGSRWVSTTYDLVAGVVVTFRSSALVPGLDDGGLVRTFTVNATGSPAGVTQWEAAATCATRRSDAPTGMVLSNANCTSVVEHEVVVVGMTAAGVPEAIGVLHDVRVDGPGVVVDVPMRAVAPRAFAFTVDQLPQGALGARLTATMTPVGASAFRTTQDVGGVAAPFARSLSLPDIDGGLLFADVTVDLGDAFVSQRLWSRGDAAELVFRGDALARPSATLERADPSRPEVTWLTTAGSRGVEGGAGFYASLGDAEPVIWSARFDPTTRQGVRFPALPEAFAAYRVAAEAEVSQSGVSFVENSFAPTYAEAVAHDGDVEEREFLAIWDY